MYKPNKDGIRKDSPSVIYVEEEPPGNLSDYVHCFWELRTKSPLSEDFAYHVLPDACVNLLFDQLDPNITAVTALQTDHRVLNLGKDFHFVGIQLLPGVWNGNPDEIKDDLVNEPYAGELSLIEKNRRISEKLSFLDKQKVFIELVEEFIENELILKNKIIATILKNIDEIRSVSDMAKLVNLSNRQLQRKMKETVWLSPHDFLKIMR
ncbi:MAG: hypothetical protein MJK18_04015 [Bdellovibrionales bacterium]|nr:hypothetical protein [Bdellovibrionales bacterium]